MSKAIKGKFKYNNKTIHFKVVQEDGTFIDSRGKQLVAYYSRFKYLPTILKHRIVLLSCSYLGYLGRQVEYLEREEEFMTFAEYSDLYNEEALNLSEDEIWYIARRKILTELNPTEFN